MPFVTPRVLAVAGTLVLFAACQDETNAPPREAPIISVPSGAVQALVQQQAPSDDGLVTFVIRVLANGQTVSSYQGTVSFVPGAFELIGKQSPTTGGMTSVLNTEKFAEGKIVFAALTPTRFDSISAGAGIEAFRFTVRPLKPVEESNIVARLDVVGTELGAAIGADRMLASPGVIMAGRTTK